MQKISFGNREYVKASEAAKRFKYTQDYVGQLCRGEKVDARLVGRVWYVNLDSIADYRKTKHATQKAGSKKHQTPTAKVKKHQVEPVVRAKTARKLQEVFPKDALRATRHVLASYSSDKATNIPVLNPRNIDQSETAVPVAKVEKKLPSVTIKVRPNTKKSTQYVAEKIPDITLQSKLKVSDDIADLVPATASDVIKTESDSPATKSDTAIRVPVTKEASGPARTAVNFHPESVSADKQPSRSNRRSSNKDSTGNKTTPKAKNPRIRTILAVLYFMSLPVAVLLVLGVSNFNETGPVTATSGVAFSAESALEKVLEFLR